MKCPVCGVDHNSINVASICKSEVDNQWGHYIILCSGMTGGVTRKNLETYKKQGLNLDNFDQLKKTREQMDLYWKKF